MFGNEIKFAHESALGKQFIPASCGIDNPSKNIIITSAILMKIYFLSTFLPSKNIATIDNGTVIK